MMLASDIISVTDLRSHMNKIFGSLSRPKFIVANNKPQAVLLGIKQYEAMVKQLEWDTVVDFGKTGINPQELLSVHDKF